MWCVVLCCGVLFARAEVAADVPHLHRRPLGGMGRAFTHLKKGEPHGPKPVHYSYSETTSQMLEVADRSLASRRGQDKRCLHKCHESEPAIRRNASRAKRNHLRLTFSPNFLVERMRCACSVGVKHIKQHQRLSNTDFDTR